ncbi:hypothetical protein IV203_016931 [Nitzschia inconspicua]|uniref:Uncharacterized protein n=1 Tax=Nitzschia inconspicua TaxID=303405 RepID=A0A9K3KRK2_9STRA|nr:hypothetical protein IV203_016931 [Nitzschia inconspicua]
MADPNEFLLMTRVREGDTDRPDDFVGAGVQKKKEKPKKKWASGETSGDSRVGDWLGGVGPKRSWKVKDVSKSTLGDLESKETEASPSHAPISISSPSTRRWKPPPKDEAALPPWMSPSNNASSNGASTSTCTSKWAPKKNIPPPPPVNRSSPAEKPSANEDSVMESTTAIVTESQPYRPKEVLQVDREESSVEETSVVDAEKGPVQRSAGVGNIEKELPSEPESCDKALPSPPTVQCTVGSAEKRGVFGISSGREVALESDAAGEFERASHDDKIDKCADVTEDNDDQVTHTAKEDNASDDTTALYAIQNSCEKMELNETASDDDRHINVTPFKDAQEEVDSDSEKYEVASDSGTSEDEEAQLSPNRTGPTVVTMETYQGPDPNDFKIMTMVREGETDRPDDFVCSVGRTRIKKDAQKKRWGSTTSAGSDRVDDWLGAPGGGKPKRSWKLKG